MADSVTYAWAADIVKTERDAAGDLLVYGKATGPDLDLDGQRCDPTWLREAMPDWYEWKNIREMHNPVCAGVGVALTSVGDDWFVKSRVVDAGTAKKIEAGALKGYSIGVKSPLFETRAGQEWISGGTIVEISYVDRPCNPTTTMTVCKMAGVEATLQPVEAPAPPALPGDVPAAPPPPAPTAVVEVAPPASGAVRTAADLRDAVAAVGCTADLPATLRHLAARAEKLGKAHLADGLGKAAGAPAPGGTQHDPATVAGVRDGLVALMKAELDELVAGEPELWDVEQLLCSLRMLMNWWSNEAAEGEVVSPYEPTPELPVDDEATVMLAAAPDTPAAAPTSGSTQDPGDDRLTALVKSAVADATSALTKTAEERNAALAAELATVKADLAKALALPETGGPVITRTSAQTAVAKASDMDLLRREAEALLTKAADMDRHDPRLANGYRTRAHELMAKAAA